MTQWSRIHVNAGDQGSIPGSGRSPGEGHGNHSSNLAWEIPWTEESGGLQSMVSQRIRLVWETEHACIWYSTKLGRHSKKQGKNMNSLSTDKAINTTRLKVTQILEPSDWKLKITMSSEINQRKKFCIKKKKFCIITYMWNLRVKKSHRCKEIGGFQRWEEV